MKRLPRLSSASSRALVRSAIVVALAAQAAVRADSFTGSVNVLNNQSYTAGTNGITLNPGSTPNINFVRSSGAWHDTWWGWTMGTDNKLRLDFCTVPQMTLQNGALGIGVDNPGARLDVAGTMHSPDCLTLGDGHWGSEGMNYTALSTFGGAVVRGNSINAGALTVGDWTQKAPALGLYVNGTTVLNSNVGIGTNTPLSRLHIKAAYDNPDSGIMIDATDNPAEPERYNLRIYPYVVGGAMVGYRFQTKSAYGGTQTPLSFDNAGNVGIGTSAPPGKFSVAGDQWFVKGGTAAIGTYDSQDFRLLGAAATGAAGKGVFVDYYSAAPATWYKAAQIKNVASGFGSLLLMQDGGNVGIGTTNPTNKLEVNGTIRTKEVIVETNGWSDYVFADDYQLAPLSAVEAHIKANKHLPGIPSAADVAANGVSVGDMQTKLLAKLEELTLHQIAQEKRLNEQAARITQLEAENANLRSR